MAASLDDNPGCRRGADACAGLSRRIALLELAVIGQEFLMNGSDRWSQENIFDRAQGHDAGVDVDDVAVSERRQLSFSDPDRSVKSCCAPEAPSPNVTVDQCAVDDGAKIICEEPSLQEKDPTVCPFGFRKENGAENSAEDGQATADGKDVSGIETFVSTTDAMDVITSQIERTIAVCESQFAEEREALYAQLQEAEQKVASSQYLTQQHSAMISDLTKRVDGVCDGVENLGRSPQGSPSAKIVTFAEKASARHLRVPASPNRSHTSGMTARALSSLRETLAAKGQSLQSVRHHRRPGQAPSNTLRRPPHSPRFGSFSPRRSPAQSSPRSSFRALSLDRLEQSPDFKTPERSRYVVPPKREDTPKPRLVSARHLPFFSRASGFDFLASTDGDTEGAVSGSENASPYSSSYEIDGSHATWHAPQSIDERPEGDDGDALFVGYNVDDSLDQLSLDSGEYDDAP